uniref:Uncharacterized protein n=1 Tax=Candidatus Kentrum sp. SD TaxID=2126332 RepID=A0A451BIN5_9GAMM|nr:MAG: hypothetical protein BECKSD772D_GA0070982_100827 [Candidatus Kentron sp. SD]
MGSWRKRSALPPCLVVRRVTPSDFIYGKPVVFGGHGARTDHSAWGKEDSLVVFLGFLEPSQQMQGDRKPVMPTGHQYQRPVPSLYGGEFIKGRGFFAFSEHKSERFAFGCVLYWLARSNKLQTGCSLCGRRFFQNLCFSDTWTDWTTVFAGVNFHIECRFLCLFNPAGFPVYKNDQKFVGLSFFAEREILCAEKHRMQKISCSSEMTGKWLKRNLCFRLCWVWYRKKH